MSLQNKVDELERLKSRKSKLSDEIKDTEAAIVRNMIRNKKKLGKLPNGGILYKLNGYGIELFDKQVVKAVREQV